MTVVGTTVRYVTADGKRVTAVAYEEQWNQPRYSVEIVDAGEVVEHFTVLGSRVLAYLARRQRWTEVGG